MPELTRAQRFGNLLTRALADAELTAAEFARLTGIDRRQLSRYVNGYQYPHDETRRRINEALGTLNLI